MLNNTSAPMAVSQHNCSLPKAIIRVGNETIEVPGGTPEAAAYQKARYGGLLCQPGASKVKGLIDYRCTFCGGIQTDAKPLR